MTTNNSPTRTDTAEAVVPTRRERALVLAGFAAAALCTAFAAATGAGVETDRRRVAGRSRMGVLRVPGARAAARLPPPRLVRVRPLRHAGQHRAY